VAHGVSDHDLIAWGHAWALLGAAYSSTAVVGWATAISELIYSIHVIVMMLESASHDFGMHASL